MCDEIKEKDLINGMVDIGIIITNKVRIRIEEFICYFLKEIFGQEDQKIQEHRDYHELRY